MKHTSVCWAILLVVLVTFIAVTGCTGSGPSSQPPAATPAPAPVTGAATVTIQNFAFSPASITVARGTTVTWTNQDSSTHQIASDAPGQFSSGPLSKGASYSFRFDTPGTYPYICSIHPSMKATVTVT